jgi:hypothetical protein
VFRASSFYADRTPDRDRHIAILAVLLLPALRSARMTARRGMAARGQMK